MNFFDGQSSLKYLNATFITLIMKSKEIAPFSEFHPISCANVSYKSIVKVLASRLAHLLPHLISLNQIAFFKGRVISDNSSLAEELLRQFEQKSTIQRAEICVDLKKAFDSGGWEAIHATLSGLGFCKSFINHVMDCVKTPNFSILIEGQPSTKFYGGRGLLQGLHYKKIVYQQRILIVVKFEDRFWKKILIVATISQGYR